MSEGAAMTSKTDGAAQGEWLIDPEFSPLPSGAVAVWFGEEHGYYRLPQALADRIIAGQRKAQMAGVLAKALEEARVEFDNISGDWSEPRGYIREGRRIIDTALAQYHAVTEEAT